MTIRVTKTSNTFNVKLNNGNSSNGTNGFRVSVSAEASSVAANFSDINDFNQTGVQNGYLIMYDSATQKYITVNPDEVLSKSVDGGLPTNFINQLDSDLDNKIDLDAGTF